MTETAAADYGLSPDSRRTAAPAPALDYQPRDPRGFRPSIGLIGCGGISEHHLKAYRRAGYRVAALCDRAESKALARRKEFYPKADVYADYRELLRRDDIEVVDITTHPAEREPIIEDALRARKHVLSQKPFVLDLDSVSVWRIWRTTGVMLASIRTAAGRRTLVTFARPSRQDYWAR